MTAPRRCVGVILAGGGATRMGGSPKGLALVGGRRIIDRVAEALRDVCDSLLIVAADPAADGWIAGVPATRDRRPGYGALSGIHAALASSDADALVVAWDMPFVSAGVLRAVRRAGEHGAVGAAAPASGSPWGFEPLAAWYAAATLPTVIAMLDADDARVGALADRAELLTVDVTSWGDPDELFLSVNDPADLERANAIAARETAR